MTPSNQTGDSTAKRARSQRFNRAKTGCFTCRARRKKCDETRDANTGGCQRCLKSGIECLGFPELRGAPLAAHSKKQKAAQDEKARKSAQSEQINDEQSHHSMQLIQASHTQPTNVEPASTFELSLTDFLHMDTPPSSETVSRTSRRITSRTASGNATPSTIDAVSQEESAQAMTAWLNSSILPFAQQREGETITSIGSPFPQFLLDDWMSSDMLNSLGNTSSGIPTNTGVTPRIMSPFQGIRDEDRALKSLASFYAAFCMRQNPY
ncbi:uncharacterized protein FA14DRAFT_175612 [Meira miltonrushii]|uniref:Zn(2)-C6 fungal-type domain-containing protein n=1 Tax=Meira miltonrushii TaxID=1280837 RepID=A0A316V1K3_9BASI|nr:uncharacterized protein FA14DRAFT_175612 [Meira miltonrushii]PWN31430.1 hypothetical protein FA14DRAFT_175612 [Meira miltonrushii]